MCLPERDSGIKDGPLLPDSSMFTSDVLQGPLSRAGRTSKSVAKRKESSWGYWKHRTFGKNWEKSHFWKCSRCLSLGIKMSALRTGSQLSPAPCPELRLDCPWASPSALLDVANACFGDVYWSVYYFYLLPAIFLLLLLAMQLISSLIQEGRASIADHPPYRAQGNASLTELCPLRFLQTLWGGFGTIPKWSFAIGPSLWGRFLLF